MVPEGPRDWSWRVEKYSGSGIWRAVPRRERRLVQRVWQVVWKRDIKSEDSWRGEGRGCRAGFGGPMLKASFGSPCFWPEGSSDSPCMDTQPRFMPPALDEWIA